MLTRERLKEIFTFDEGVSIFIRKVDMKSHKAGTQSGWISGNGYRHIIVDKKTYLYHRVIWLWYYGEWPRIGLDHIDGNPLNNKIENLREATQSQNMANKRDDSKNTSGRRGVYWNKKRKKWYAQLRKEKRTFNLGHFIEYNAAVEARINAEAKYFGEFARK